MMKPLSRKSRTMAMVIGRTDSRTRWKINIQRNKTQTLAEMLLASRWPKQMKHTTKRQQKRIKAKLILVAMTINFKKTLGNQEKEAVVTNMRLLSNQA